MKRLILVATALFVLLTLCVASASGAAVGTWLTYREDISIDSGYGDIDTTFWYNGTGTSADVSVNLTLPSNVLNLSGSQTNFTICVTGAGTNGTYNLTVNGNACNSSSWCNRSVQNITTLTQMISAGVTNTDEYLNFTWNCTTSDTKIGINLTGSNVNFSTTWRTNVITIKEKDVTKLPYVGKSSTTSIHTVNNSFNVSNSTLWFPVTTCVFNITYPSHKISEPSTSFSVATLAANGSAQDYVQYQKYGPYVYNVDEDVDGREHEVTIKVKGNEVLTNCVYWSIDPDDEVYDDVFDDLDYDSLEVTLNGISKDWDKDGDDVELEDFTIREGIGNNKFVFTWTEPAVPPVVAVPSIWDQIADFFTSSLGPFPVWLVIVLLVIFVIALATLSIGEKETESRGKKKV